MRSGESARIRTEGQLLYEIISTKNQEDQDTRLPGPTQYVYPPTDDQISKALISTGFPHTLAGTRQAPRQEISERPELGCALLHCAASYGQIEFHMGSDAPLPLVNVRVNEKRQ
jgi:hypothetical protein